jgi:hypothetical protein
MNDRLLEDGDIEEAFCSTSAGDDALSSKIKVILYPNLYPRNFKAEKILVYEKGIKLEI